MKGKDKQVKQSEGFTCGEHGQKATFVCLQKTCALGFRLGCIKCRKQHGQHPNRLIAISEFHKMLARPIKYLENATAFSLMNLKKKVQYLRNFRISILQKEVALVQNNRCIKEALKDILEEHLQIRDIVGGLDSETLEMNPLKYLNYLSRSRDFIVYNPVKFQVQFTNQAIKIGRTGLDKYLKISNGLIDNIREYLIKMIEVLLATCTHDQEDDQIEFDEQGEVSPTSFNLYIKNRTDAIDTPAIKQKLEHFDILQIFDEEKQAFGKQVEMLEQELEEKGLILNRIKSQTTPKLQSEKQQKTTIEEIYLQNVSLKQQIVKIRQSRSSLNSESVVLQQMKSKYSQTINNKELQLELAHKKIEQLQNRISVLDISTSQAQKQKQKNESIIKKNHKQQVSNYEKRVFELQKNINNAQQSIAQYKKTVEEKDKKIEAIQTSLRALETEKQKQSLNQQKSQTQIKAKMNILTSQLETSRKKNQALNSKFVSLEESSQKQKDNLQKQLHKVKQQAEHKQKTLTKNIDQLKIQEQKMKESIKILQAKSKKLEENGLSYNKKINELNFTISDLQKKYKQKEQILIAKCEAGAHRTKQLEQNIKNARLMESPIKNDDRKIREIKEMLEVAIKQNQQLKDKNYQLEMEIHEYRSKGMTDSIKQGCNKFDLQSTNAEGLGETSNKQVQQKNKSRTQQEWRMPTQPLVQHPGFQKIKNQQSEEIFVLQRGQVALREKFSFVNKDSKKQAYQEIKNIFKAVSQDMSILEQRLKQNTVIEKVYLKELERKRNQNKNLKKQLQSIKVYGKPQEERKTSQNGKEKVEVIGGNAGKIEYQNCISKKNVKGNIK